MIGTPEKRLSELDMLYPVWEMHTVWTRFEKNSGIFSENPFIVTENRTYTYGETKEQAVRMAFAMGKLGIRPGDHVALRLHNCPEHLFLSLALSKIGAVRVPLHLKCSGDCLDFVLEKADVNWIFAVTCQEKQEKLSVRYGTWLRCEKGQQIPEASWKRFCELGDSYGKSPEKEKKSEKQNQLSDILFTSGSTHEPKGVMLTADMMLRSAYASCRTRYMEIGRRMYVPIPFYHAFAYVEGFLAMMLIGGSLILSEDRFSVEHALRLMKEYGANDVICISSMMVNLVSRGMPKPEDYPELHAAYWAASCPDWVWEEAGKGFGITDITTGYGMTECGSTTFMLSPDDGPAAPLHCHGRLKQAGSAGDPRYKGHLMEVRICDTDSGQMRLTGETGELQCRGFTVTPGYYQNEEANHHAFTEDGWFRTGDLCSRLENGCFVFKGRKDDVYKINGENVSPAYLDKVISGCPIVREVQTVGITHPKYGAVGVAFIDSDMPQEQAAPVLEEYCRTHLINYQVPKYLIWSSQESWPRTGTGKISKTELQKMAIRQIMQR